MYTLELTHYNGEVTYLKDNTRNILLQVYDKELARPLKKRVQAQQVKAFVLSKDKTIERVSIIEIGK